MHGRVAELPTQPSMGMFQTRVGRHSVKENQGFKKQVAIAAFIQVSSLKVKYKLKGQMLQKAVHKYKEFRIFPFPLSRSLGTEVCLEARCSAPSNARAVSGLGMQITGRPSETVLLGRASPTLWTLFITGDIQMQILFHLFGG